RPAATSRLSAHPPPAGPESSTLSLHDALPIYRRAGRHARAGGGGGYGRARGPVRGLRAHGGAQPWGRVLFPLPVPQRRLRPGRSDRKSTRLNSSHVKISYAVFCLKKKIKNQVH